MHSTASTASVDGDSPSRSSSASSPAACSSASESASPDQLRLQVGSPTGAARATAGAPSPLVPSAGPKSPTRAPLTYLEAMLLLTQGATFVKFPASTSAFSSMLLGGSAPSTRYVYYEKGEERGGMGTLYWCREGKRIRDPARSIPLRTIEGLFEQAETPAFAKQLATLTPEGRSRCFSVVAKGRTLDLQAPSIEQRDLWMHAIHTILVHSGFGVREVDSNSLKDPNPGNMKSPSSDSLTAIQAAERLRAMQLSSPGANGVSPSSSPAASTMLSPPAAGKELPANTPQAAGSKCTPANTPVAVAQLAGAPATVLLDDPLAAKLASSPAAKEDRFRGDQEIPSSLRLPQDQLTVAPTALSPSEHPTQTPACSPE